MQHKKHTVTSQAIVLGATLLVVFGAMGGALAKDAGGIGGGYGPMNPQMGSGPMGGDPFKDLVRGLNANSIVDKIDQLSQVCDSIDVEINCDSSVFDAQAEKLSEYNDKMEELGSKVEDALLDEDMAVVKELKSEFKALKKSQSAEAKVLLKDFKAAIKVMSKDFKAAVKAQRDADKAEMKQQQDEMSQQQDQMKQEMLKKQEEMKNMQQQNQTQMQNQFQQHNSADDMGRGMMNQFQPQPQQGGSQNGGTFFCGSLQRMSTSTECNAADSARGFNPNNQPQQNFAPQGGQQGGQQGPAQGNTIPAQGNVSN